jgi:hypothetical protein
MICWQEWFIKSAIRHIRQPATSAMRWDDHYRQIQIFYHPANFSVVQVYG